MSGGAYEFSIEDFYNNTEVARLYIIRQHVKELMILAATTISDGNEVEQIVNDVYMELFKHRKEFHSQSAIKDFLYRKVKEECEAFLKK